MKVYTLFYFPFVMGGDTWQPRCCEVEADGPHDLGQGYTGFLITSPNGYHVVAEAESGAFVGPSLESVRKDITEADPEVMERQVEQAIQQSKGCIEMEPEEFWSRWEKAAGLSKSNSTAIVDRILEE